MDPEVLRAKNDSGMTPVHFAVQNAQPKVSSACLDVLQFIGANDAQAILLKDKSGSTACHVAAEKNNKTAITFFIKTFPECLRDTDKQGRHPCHLMAFQARAAEFSSQDEFLIRWFRLTCQLN